MNNLKGNDMGTAVSTEVREVAEIIRGNIREQVASAIPKTLIDRMLDEEIDRFLTGDGQDSLKAMIALEVRKKYQDAVVSAISEIRWSDANGTPSETVARIIAASAPAIVDAFVGKLVQAATFEVENALRNSFNRF